ncbi:cell wall adhesin EAP1 [Diachasma alloeum]|uniref:cell wall adhesin EAP1 n=1 Tax=Diachasma alloeum TaxID=454923 RepID=UPI0007383B1D|nr:cell wall adhesin EAP1 [Diachasma alloeum]
MFRKREADAKFDGERGDAMRNSAFMVNVAEKQELHDISYKSNNNFSNRPTLDTVKSIQSEENFGAQTAPAPSAQGLDEKNFQVTSGLFQKFFPNSSPQLLKIDYQGPVIYKLGVASKGPQQTSSPPGENQLSPVFDYFLKYRETKPYGEQHNVIKCPVSGAQSSTTDSSSEVGGCYTKPEAPISSGIVQAPTGVQSAEANTEKSETPSTAATEVPEVQSTAAKEDGPSTENTGITNEPSTETTGISVEDPSSEATVPPEAPSTEATEVLKTPSTEATEIPIEDLSTEATGPLEGQLTEATQIPEDPSTEATEISEDLSTIASETPEDQSTEATEISEGPSTEVTAVPVSLSLEVFQTPEDSSTEATEIPEDSSTETLSADETWTTAAALSEIEPSPTEATDVTEPNEQFTTEDQQGVNLTDEVLFTDVKDKNNSPVSEETEEVFDTRSANDTKKSQLEFETISSNDNVEVESNAEVPQPELLESLPDTDPRQASKAIADAINAYEADGSPNAVERLQDILEATVNITGDVEDPDEAALDTDEDAEDDV